MCGRADGDNPGALHLQGWQHQQLQQRRSVLQSGGHRSSAERCMTNMYTIDCDVRQTDVESQLGRHHCITDPTSHCLLQGSPWICMQPQQRHVPVIQRLSLLMHDTTCSCSSTSLCAQHRFSREAVFLSHAGPQKDAFVVHVRDQPPARARHRGAPCLHASGY